MRHVLQSFRLFPGQLVSPCGRWMYPSQIIPNLGLVALGTLGGVAERRA